MNHTNGALREKALRALRAAVDDLRDAGTPPSDEDAVRRAIATACDNEGISPRDYDAVVHRDPELTALEEHALDFAVVGATDPGPYGEISRESRSGLPGDLTKSRQNPDEPLVRDNDEWRRRHPGA